MSAALLTTPGADAPGPQAGEAGAATLDDLLALVRAVNPFTDNRVNGPSPDDVDVGRIHQAAFVRLTELAEEALRERRGLGAVLWGEAGIGKSHLLSRLSRWAGGGRACFVYLHNLQAGPEHLPRSLLRLVVRILTGNRVRQLQATELFELTRAWLCEAVGPDTARAYAWAELERAAARLLQRMSAAEPARAALIDRIVYHVFFRFFQSAERATRKGRDDGIAALAVRWLGGDALDPDEAARLGLPPRPGRDEPAALADNQQVKQVLVALSRMAQSAGRPLLFCFDQVDNFDEGQAAGLARFLEALIDGAPNLLVVTAGVQATLFRWRTNRVIQDSAWDRLGQFEVALQRVPVTEAGALVAARVDRFFAPFDHLAAVRQRRQDDPLFPLGRAWWEAHARDRIEFRPRDVLNAAREAWRREQERLRASDGASWLAQWDSPAPPAPTWPMPEQVRQAIDRRVAEEVDEQVRQQRAHAEAAPADADQLTGLLLGLLDPCVGWYGLLEVRPVFPPRPGARPACDLLLRRREGGGERTVGVTAVATASATSAAGSLRRLVQDDEAPDTVLLVTDERLPLMLGDRGREYFQELRQRGAARFRHVELTVADLAELAALRATVELAAAGDLEVELLPGHDRALSESEVVEAFHRQHRLRVAPLLRELLGGAPVPSTQEVVSG